jgi:hypothetical protein
MIVNYIMTELRNKNPLLPKDKWIHLLLSSCIHESDLKLIHEAFFISDDREIKQCVLEGIFKFCDEDMYILDIKMQKLFFDIFNNVCSWNDDHYTSRLLQYCFFIRTADVYTVDEIYEMLVSVNDDVFYMFFSGICHGEFNFNYEEGYGFDDTEKEQIRKIIKLRNHPRGEKLLELFK